jgi:hypothetical protein
MWDIFWPRGRQKAGKRKPARYRPRLEALEDRWVPATLLVTSPLDDGSQGTLRYDIAHAQSGDTIEMSPTVAAPIVLTQGELYLKKNLTIEGQASQPETISGNNSSRVFEVAAKTNVTLMYLNLTGGNGLANPTDTPSLAGFHTKDYAGEGGGILNFGTLTVNNSTLSGNSTDYIYGGGGGIFNQGGTVSVSNSTLSGNSAMAGGGGGAIYNYAYGTLTVTSSTLSDNSAPSVSTHATYGGAIYNEYSTLTVTGSTLSGNSAGSYGGAIANNIDSTATVNNSTLSGNFADSGGAISTAYGTLTVSNSILSSNSAGTFGGGIFNGSTTVTVSNSTLSGNSAKDGGGIANLSGTLTLSGCTLSGNSASVEGGGIYNHNSTLTVSGSTLTGNSASVEGGGIYNYGDAAALTILDSYFCNNSPDNIYGLYTDEGANTFC